MTMRLRKFDGRFLLRDEEAHEIQGELLDRPAVLLKSPSGDLHEMPVEEFRLHISMGRVTNSAGQSESNRLGDSEEQRERRIRERILKRNSELKRLGMTWSLRIEEMTREFREDPEFQARGKAFPTSRTIQIWQRSFLREGQAALHDRRHQSGNRLPRHDWLFEEIVYDLLETQYLQSDRKTLAAVARDAGLKYLEACREKKRTPLPHGEKVVRSLIDALPHADVIKRRLGSEESRKALIQAGRFQKIEAPLERVEIDSTEADIFVIIDTEGHVARPTICAAIDAATGFVVGLQVALSKPNGLLTAMTLREVMTPTLDAFFDENGIENRHQAYGRPFAVVSDQGNENAGQLVEACLTVGQFEFRKNIPGHPEKKPFIERFFRTLNQFLQTLPGATATAELGNARRTKRAMTEACISFEELNRIVQKWRFDVHARRPQRRVQSALRTAESPTACWRRLSEEHLIPEPPTVREIQEMFFASTARRILHHYGIEFEGIQYSSSELRALLRELGPRHELEIRSDPTDIRAIAVLNPLSNEHLLVPAKEEGLPAISFEELKRIRKHLSPDPSEPLSAQEVLKAMAEGIHEKERSAPRTKHQKARHKAEQKRTNDAIIERSKKKPALGEQEGAADVTPTIPVTRPSKLPSVKSKKPQ
ncbi:hypothetical protein BMI86_17470 [Thioclava sp. DLFJ5-1]|uniref:Mu transposase C-terminal domain-containing protein n=1 Tax=Thioclava sp. DLFJ5-1 TaxID=1915314 RepID=UPI000997603B|nr:Mu transposase C-terminal domain-containing protein [Thioclava sp. DLFJ5-1]OOY18943.1 hypothetical protein BMI86_17470 [Thioclava sp. DLFJ5-1]